MYKHTISLSHTVLTDGVPNAKTKIKHDATIIIIIILLLFFAYAAWCWCWLRWCCRFCSGLPLLLICTHDKRQYCWQKNNTFEIQYFTTSMPSTLKASYLASAGRYGYEHGVRVSVNRICIYKRIDIFYIYGKSYVRLLHSHRETHGYYKRLLWDNKKSVKNEYIYTIRMLGTPLASIRMSSAQQIEEWMNEAKEDERRRKYRNRKNAIKYTIIHGSHSRSVYASTRSFSNLQFRAPA